jgi:hypothetical protein
LGFISVTNDFFNIKNKFIYAKQTVKRAFLLVSNFRYIILIKKTNNAFRRINLLFIGSKSTFDFCKKQDLKPEECIQIQSEYKVFRSATNKKMRCKSV